MVVPGNRPLAKELGSGVLLTRGSPWARQQRAVPNGEQPERHDPGSARRHRSTATSSRSAAARDNRGTQPNPQGKGCLLQPCIDRKPGLCSTRPGATTTGLTI